MPSPGNRYVYLPSDETPVLYDRLTGRAFTWDAEELSLVREIADAQRFWDTYTNSLLGWASGEDEWLVVRKGNSYAVIDHSMEAVAWFQLDESASPLRWWPHPDGTHLLVQSLREGSSGSMLHAIDLVGRDHRAINVPAPYAYPRTSAVHASRPAIAVVSGAHESNTCSIVRYDWSLEVLSEVSLPCAWPTLDLSPNGKLVVAPSLSFGARISEPGTFPRLSAVSLFDAATGEELIRVKGAIPSDAHFGLHDGRTRWLADSSGLVLDTRNDTRIVSVDGRTLSVLPRDPYQGRGLLIPSRDDPVRMDRPLEPWPSYCDGTGAKEGRCLVPTARVADGDGQELASLRLVLHIAPDSAWDMARGDIWASPFNRTSWGLTSDELRVHLVLGGPYESAGYRPVLPPVVDQPPFAELTALEVVEGEACRHLREAPASVSPSIACLPGGAVVESVAPPDETHYMPDYSTGHLVGRWAHVRTTDGVEGWMHLDGLRWAQ